MVVVDVGRRVVGGRRRRVDPAGHGQRRAGDQELDGRGAEAGVGHQGDRPAQGGRQRVRRLRARRAVEDLRRAVRVLSWVEASPISLTTKPWPVSAARSGVRDAAHRRRVQDVDADLAVGLGRGPSWSSWSLALAGRGRRRSSAVGVDPMALNCVDHVLGVRLRPPSARRRPPTRCRPRWAGSRSRGATRAGPGRRWRCAGGRPGSGCRRWSGCPPRRR